MLEHILNGVRCPARYSGGEWNIVRKDPKAVDLRFAMCFPDVYEVGMSHLGSKILYHEINKRDDALCERVFSPWPDMEQSLRQNNYPLFSLENRLPLSEFDVCGFTLQYELTFTNILNMLDLGGIPLRSERRDERHPLVIAGGPCAYNPEPIAEFIDAFVIGEGEEVVHEIIECVNALGGRGAPREKLLLGLSRIHGVYVPALYDVTYEQDGRVAQVRPNRCGVPEQISKRVIEDLNCVDYPVKPIVPFIDVVHDRAVVEVFRGCTRGCRFCQAGAIYRPVRERSLDKVGELASEILENTGYDEVSLTSLSSSDYGQIEEAIDDLHGRYSDERIGISLPSLRSDEFSVRLAEKVQKVRRTGLTFAPEAGTQRLRNVINKNVTDEQIEAAARAAFDGGFSSIKLYFMIGLPTETEEDVRGIAETARKIERISREIGGRAAKMTVSVASFVPKSHTPFQWEPQDTVDVLHDKQALLRSLLRSKTTRFDWHEAHQSLLEAVFARGDRRLASSVEAAFRAGARFDGWSDLFSYERWQQAFSETGIDPSYYANRRRDHEETLPWDHVSAGLDKSWLIEENRRALMGLVTPDCRSNACSACGVCQNLGIEHLLKGSAAR